MLHVSTEEFYQDLLRFGSEPATTRVMQAVEQDCLYLLRTKGDARSSDTVDTLSADAADLLMATELAFYKYVPLYISDPQYQDGDHRAASLRHIFKCRRTDWLRSEMRRRKYTPVSLDGEVGEDGATILDFIGEEEGSDPADILERSMALTEESIIWKTLTIYCSLKTDPANMIAYLYKTFCGRESSTVVRQDASSRSGVVKKTVADLTGRTYRDALAYTHRVIEATLDCRIPRECMAALYDRLETRDKAGVLYGDKVFALSARTVTERGSWIDSKTRPLILKAMEENEDDDPPFDRH